ncbi:MAG TPA: glycosyltransferase [Acidisoma sp.]|uniref:glycosyltransferase n=1 Tax=Acidisoma sp. TaxID=1872115 RepID=UPI002C4DEA75|nr:glycosyltransferase [Acidisoma sp.]HTI01437.1 glycosyltransferase [Acidisoma sp.]
MRVAVIIAARNLAPFIGDAIRSVLRQSHPDLTLILVDDGSEDATADRAIQIGGSRLHLLQQPAQGISHARNRGAAHPAARAAEALLFLDGDDWLAPDAIARLCAGLAGTPGAAAIQAPFAYVAEGATPDAAGALDHRKVSGTDLLARLILGNLFANGGHVLIRSEAWARAGGFREDLRFAEDWEFWPRLALLGPILAAAGPPALFVRRRQGSLMHGAATRLAAYEPTLAAIAQNADIAARLGPARLAHLSSRARRELLWTVGREMLRRGEASPALPLLRRGIGGRPRPQRLLILARALWLARRGMETAAES